MKTLKKVFEYELPIAIRKENGGYYAYSSLWPDCYAQGDTIDEVSSEIIAVAQTLIEIYKEENLVIPLKKITEKTFANNFTLTLPIVVSA